MDFGFTFRIGDWVKLVGTQARPLPTAKSWADDFLRRETRYLVVSRMLEQCYGGTQRHYFCRGVSGTEISRELLRFSEMELLASEPFDAGK
jgi:hypothetical protein